MDPNSQNYWQPKQQDAPAQPSSVPTQPQPVPQQGQAPSSPVPAQPSAYNGYDLTTPAAVGGAAIQSTIDQAAPDEASVSWEASEYVHHQKGILWFLTLGIVSAVILGVALWFQAWSFAVLVVIMAVAVGVYALRKPRPVHYSLTDQGIKIGEKIYNYGDFRAFGVIPDGGVFSVMLLPTKRFMPAITVYFGEPDGERIIDMLGSRLPMEEVDHDFVDRLMRRLRF